MTSNIKGKEPVNVNDGTFDGFVTGNSAAVIDCWAPWCHPCRILSPIIDQLAMEYGEIAFGKLNVDENPVIPTSYGLLGIPTVLYFKEGNLMDRTVGVLPKKAIEKKLNDLIK